MAEERVERRLAAILAADMVGYSRLMESDEAGTLAALKAHRSQLIDSEIAAHKGRIVKTTGDGLLAEFASIVDAVAGAAAPIVPEPTPLALLALGSVGLLRRRRRQAGES